jgi:hypothetical protein
MRANLKPLRTSKTRAALRLVLLSDTHELHVNASLLGVHGALDKSPFVFQITKR